MTRQERNSGYLRIVGDLLEEKLMLLVWRDACVWRVALVTCHERSSDYLSHERISGYLQESA